MDQVNLADVMDEVALAMKQITGLNKFHESPPASISAPMGYVAYPQSIDYDQTYAHGLDQITDLPVVCLVGKPTEKQSRDRVAAWSRKGGPDSVYRMLEEWTWSSCHDVKVESCEFDVWQVAGIDYLVAGFNLTVMGPGED